MDCTCTPHYTPAGYGFNTIHHPDCKGSAMTKNPIENEIRKILEDEVDVAVHYGNPVVDSESAVVKLIRLVGDEKSKSYGLGFTDGERKIKRSWSLY